jgi:hypothetical protein
VKDKTNTREDSPIAPRVLKTRQVKSKVTNVTTQITTNLLCYMSYVHTWKGTDNLIASYLYIIQGFPEQAMPMVLPLGQLSPLDKDQLVMKLEQLNSRVKHMALDSSEGMKPLLLVLMKMVMGQ